jgi:dethiobiotin synthetase
MKQAFFIAGTDTGVGKTHVACKLIAQYIALGHKVLGMKPVAAGCDVVNGEWVNEDVLKLEAASNVSAPRAQVNPYCFNAAIAPHLAAEKTGTQIDLSLISQAFLQLQSMADIVIVEGAGGLLVPLNQQHNIADCIEALNIPVILVVGIKLGCINHALLTIEVMKARQLTLHGWVANHLSADMPVAAENVATLTRLIGQLPMAEYTFDA